jgi:2-keto-4-pentenoate hydratase
MTPAEIAALADKVAAARRERRVMDFMPGATDAMSEDEAYHTQFAVHERLTANGADRIVGWKVAVSLPALYQGAGLSQPAFAGIYSSGVKQSGVAVARGDILKAGVECEVVARIARDAPQGVKPYDAESIKALVSSLHCGMEIVENRHADLGKVTGKGRIVDEFLQYACVVGPEIGNWQGVDLGKVDGSCALDGNKVAGGPGTNVMGGPLIALAWLANRLNQFGKQLNAGDVILTGSTHPPYMLPGAGTVTATWQGLGETKATFG